MRALEAVIRHHLTHGGYSTDREKLERLVRCVAAVYTALDDWAKDDLDTAKLAMDIVRQGILLTGTTDLDQVKDCFRGDLWSQ